MKQLFLYTLNALICEKYSVICFEELYYFMAFQKNLPLEFDLIFLQLKAQIQRERRFTHR